MYKITLELKNQYKILAMFNQAPQGVAECIQSSMAKTAGTTVGKVKDVIRKGIGMLKAPLDTGAMMRNIHISEIAPLRIIVQPNYTVTPYAERVILGTGTNRNYGARDFLAITKEMEEKNINEFFLRALENYLNNLIR